MRLCTGIYKENTRRTMCPHISAPHTPTRDHINASQPAATQNPWKENAFSNKCPAAQTTCSNRHNTTPTNAASTRNRKHLNPPT